MKAFAGLMLLALAPGIPVAVGSKAGRITVQLGPGDGTGARAGGNGLRGGRTTSRRGDRGGCLESNARDLTGRSR